MNSFRIPLSYTPVDRKSLNDVMDAYSGKHHNEMIYDFEKSIKQCTAAPHAVALNSGTAAIHLGLQALNVSEGDVVLVSTFTYVASVNPIVYLKAIPYFIDSEPASWNMDPSLLEDAIKSCIRRHIKPKAVILVYAYGMPGRIEEIMEVCRRYDISVLEDAAEAVGSTYKGQHVGTFGDIGVLSFNNNKLITTYGGGALLTKSEAVYKKVLHWASQSREDQPFYEHLEIGYSYRMGPINAAAGLSEMRNLETYLSRRRECFHQYQEAFGDLKGVATQVESEGSFSNRWLSTFTFSEKGLSERLQSALAREGVETRPLWKPMHMQPVFKSGLQSINGTAQSLFETGVCLPSGSNLEKTDQLDIIRHILGQVSHG